MHFATLATWTLLPHSGDCTCESGARPRHRATFGDTEIPPPMKSARLCLLVLTVYLPAMTFAATRDVGPGQPYSTIQSCLNAAVAGDVCNVHAGTYNETLSLSSSGTSTASITLQANPGDIVNVQSSNAPVLNLNGKSYWSVNGLNFTYNGSGSNVSGIGTNSGSVNYITLSNNTVTLNGGGCSSSGGIAIPNADHLTVSGNTIKIFTTSGCDGAELLLNSNLQFTGNTIYGNADGTTGKLEDGMVVSGTNLNIENNVLHDGWSYNTHPDGIVVQGDGDRNGNLTANVKVWRNTVYNFTQGIYFDAIHNPLQGTNLVADNLIYEQSNFQYPTGTYN